MAAQLAYNASWDNISPSGSLQLLAVIDAQDYDFEWHRIKMLMIMAGILSDKITVINKVIPLIPYYQNIKG